MKDSFRLSLLGLAVTVLLVNLFPSIAFLRGFFDGDLTSTLVDRDFVNYWMGSSLALGGELTDLFGQREYFAQLEEEFGPQRQIRAWSYPPHILLPLIPLGLLPYETALALFLIVTFAMFIAGAEALRRTEMPDADRLVFAAAIAAYATVNMNAAQNGFLTGALLLFGLAFRGRRPLLAGVAFGFLTIKPQLGLLVPLLLLVERDWATILWSGVVALVLMALSAIIFGTGVWTAYLTVTVAEQHRVLANWTGTFLYMMPTVFGAARSIGVEPSLAALLQWPVSVISVLAAAWLFIKDRWRLGRTFVLLCATFLVSPYAFDYDMGALVVAATLMLATKIENDRASLATLTAVALLPTFVLPLGSLGVPVAPLVLAAALWSRLRNLSSGPSLR